jgi:ferric-dicitrate binding protein FerR (iron transport regulator)
MNEDVDNISRNFFAKKEINFHSSREEAWKNMEAILDDDKSSNKPTRIFVKESNKKKQNPLGQWIAIAASVAVLMAVAAFLRYYSTSVETSDSSKIALMPDNTKITLEAGSTLRYHPAWWWRKRDVYFEGVARFEVTSGNTFRAISGAGTTEVLGTTFKIESGDKKYTVECYSGSVKVSDPASSVSAILMANEKAELTGQGIFDIQLIVNKSKSEETFDDFITFRSEPVSVVFEQLEKRFGVKIEYASTSNLQYSGNFRSDMDLDELLSLICLPLGLKYEEVSKDTYRIAEEE